MKHFEIKDETRLLSLGDGVRRINEKIGYSDITKSSDF